MTNFEDIPSDWILWPLIAVFGTLTLIFVAIQLFGKRDNSWITPCWGITISIPNAVLLGLRGTDSITPRMWLISVPVFVWAIRLFVYCVARKKEEDFRYKQMREEWSENSLVGYFLKTYFFVYLF